MPSRTTLTWLASAGILLLTAGLALFTSNLYLQQRATAEAEARLLTLIEATVNDWSADALLSHADLELLEASPETFWRRYIRSLHVLGNRQGSMDIQTREDIPALWQAWWPALWHERRDPRIDYDIRLQFSNDEARIQAQLVRRDGQWKVSQFRVLTSLLAA